MACAWACRASNISWRRWAAEKGRSSLAMRASSMRNAASRSRRHRADISPSMADAATPATEVPNDRPSPLMGAASAARIDSRLDEASSAKTAPLKVTTMPRKVPSMPSMTRSPTRYGASAGPGRGTRSPSIRWRTGLRKDECRRSSQPPRSTRGCCPSPASAMDSDEVAARNCISS